MQLFFHSEITQNTANFSFEAEESQHIAKVLRKKEGDRLFVTNGKGFLFECELSFISPKRCEAVVLTSNLQKKHSYRLHLAVAPTKMNERYEWFLEKAVEIGVDEITPIICHYSERNSIKMERFEKIIVSAMKQSLQCYLPVLNKPILFNDFMQVIDNQSLTKFIAHCYKEEKNDFSKELVSFPEKIVVLIGPEGDFSSEEVKKALANDFKPIALGENRLRTETAAVVACNIVSTLASLSKK